VPEPVIRNISDTARWVATYRARETERPDALFRDPLAARLAGERGERIAGATPNVAGSDWPFIVRTVLFDRIVAEEVKRGIYAVVNLAAGLDTRPYRMTLPASLRWVEVDLPEILQYKSDALVGERPTCVLERVALDLAMVNERRALFKDIGGNARRTLVISEGLLIYLNDQAVGSLARDLAAVPGFERWVLDLASPGLLQMMKQRGIGAMTSAGGAPFQFAPPEGPSYFEPFGWTAIGVESLFEEAARLKRLPFLLRLMSLLPQGKAPNRIWSGVCRLHNSKLMTQNAKAEKF
jgi:methyltransferase (TIGR00027 family)